jgi:hypothetical protein
MKIPTWPSTHSSVFKWALIIACLAVAVFDGVWLGAGRMILYSFWFGGFISLVLPNSRGMKLLLCSELAFVILEARMPVLARFCVLISAMGGFVSGIFLREIRTGHRRIQRATKRD